MPAGPRALAATATKATEATKDSGFTMTADSVGDRLLKKPAFDWEEMEPKGLPVSWHRECEGFITPDRFMVPDSPIQQRDACRAAEMAVKGIKLPQPKRAVVAPLQPHTTRAVTSSFPTVASSARSSSSSFPTAAPSCSPASSSSSFPAVSSTPSWSQLGGHAWTLPRDTAYRYRTYGQQQEALAQ